MNTDQFKPYQMVWNIENKIPCMIVNIEDCDYNLQSEYNECYEDKVPVVYFQFEPLRFELVWKLCLFECNTCSNKMLFKMCNEEYQNGCNNTEIESNSESGSTYESPATINNLNFTNPIPSSPKTTEKLSDDGLEATLIHANEQEKIDVVVEEEEESRKEKYLDKQEKEKKDEDENEEQQQKQFQLEEEEEQKEEKREDEEAKERQLLQADQKQLTQKEIEQQQEKEKCQNQQELLQKQRLEEVKKVQQLLQFQQQQHKQEEEKEKLQEEEEEKQQQQEEEEEEKYHQQRQLLLQRQRLEEVQKLQELLQFEQQQQQQQQLFQEEVEDYIKEEEIEEKLQIKPQIPPLSMILRSKSKKRKSSQPKRNEFYDTMNYINIQHQSSSPSKSKKRKSVDIIQNKNKTTSSSSSSPRKRHKKNSKNDNIITNINHNKNTNIENQHVNEILYDKTMQWTCIVVDSHDLALYSEERDKYYQFRNKNENKDIVALKYFNSYDGTFLTTIYRSSRFMKFDRNDESIYNEMRKKRTVNRDKAYVTAVYADTLREDNKFAISVYENVKCFICKRIGENLLSCPKCYFKYHLSCLSNIKRRITYSFLCEECESLIEC